MSNNGKKDNNDFEPRLVGFLCRWCSYQGADLAGTSRIEYPPNLTPIRVMCSGRVDPSFVLQAFANGADGVALFGCHPGDCHYKEGNYKALRRYNLLKLMLSQFGIEQERLRLEWVSAAEGERFATKVEEIVEEIRKLGPLKWNGVLESRPAAREVGEEHPMVEKEVVHV
jgi:F420-non-reducing hydrogenase iron-sulfur subunit